MTALSEISKKRLTPEQKAEQQRQRTQARVGLASNVLGLGAGTAGLYAAAKDPALRKKIGTTVHTKPVKISGKTKALAGGALALQAANIGGDVVANRVLARSAGGPEGVKKEYNAESWTEVYVAKADHTLGHGSISKLSDSEFRSQVKERTKEHRRANIIGGTVSGATLGGLTGTLLPTTKGKVMARRAGIGAAVGGAAMAGALNAAHSRALNRATKDPVARYKIERGMERQDRLKARALQAAADRNAVQKAYRRYDPEADRQRRLGLGAGAGIGTAAILGSQAAKRYTLSLPEKNGKKLRGIAVRPGRGKAAAALTAGAIASGAAGAAAYKRGLSERNNPWT